MTGLEVSVGQYVKRSFEKAGLVTIAWMALVVFGVAMIMSLMIVGALLSQGSEGVFTGGLGTILSLIAAAMAGVLGAGWTGEGGASAMYVNVDGSMTLSVMSLTTLASVVTGVTLVLRRRARSDVPAPNLGFAAIRAGIEGFAISVVFTLALSFVRVNLVNVPGVQGQLHGRPVVMLFMLGMLLTATILVVREVLNPASKLRPVLATPFVRETYVFLIASVAAFVPAMLGLLVVAMIKTSPTIVLLAIPYLLNVLLALVSFGYLGGGIAAVPMAGGELLMIWDLGVWPTVVVYVSTLLSLFVGAAAVGLRRQRGVTLRPQLIWQLPVGGIIAWLVIVLFLLPISLSAGVSMLGAMRMQLTVTWWVPFTATIAAFLVAVLAEFAPAWIYLISPKMLRWFAPAATVNHWLLGAPLAYAQMPERATLGQGAEYAAPAQSETHPVSEVDPSTGDDLMGPQHMSTSGRSEGVADVADASVGLQAPAYQFDPHAVSPLLVSSADFSETTPLSDNLATNLAQDPHEQTEAQLELPERRPMTPKRRLGIVLGLVGVAALALIVVASVVTVNIINSSRGPEAAVESYLTEIANGKVESATRAVDPGVRTADRGLLTNEVAGAADHRIEVIDVFRVDEGYSEDSASRVIEAELSIDGERQAARFQVNRVANSFGFLQNWAVTTPLIQKVRVESPVEFTELEIGEKKVVVAVESSADEWQENYFLETYLYPGEYMISIPDSEFAEFSSETIAVKPESMEPHEFDYYEPMVVPIEATGSKKLQATVLELANAEFNKCVTIPTNMEDYCPYEVRNTDLAVLELGALPDGFEEFTLNEFTTSMGVMRTQQNKTAWSEPSLEETKIALSGSYKIIDGKVVISDVRARNDSFWGW